jgi:hypothetical protein
MNLKLDMDNPAESRGIAPGSSQSCGREKNAEVKTVWLKFFRSSFWQVFVVRFTYALTLSAPPWTEASALRRFLDHFTARETGCFRRLCGHETATRQRFYRVAAV